MERIFAKVVEILLKGLFLNFRTKKEISAIIVDVFVIKYLYILSYIFSKFPAIPAAEWRSGEASPTGQDRGADDDSSIDSRRLCVHAHGVVGYVQEAAGF